MGRERGRNKWGGEGRKKRQGGELGEDNTGKRWQRKIMIEKKEEEEEMNTSFFSYPFSLLLDDHERRLRSILQEKRTMDMA